LVWLQKYRNKNNGSGQVSCTDYSSLYREPVTITGKRNNVILVSEEDWRSVEIIKAIHDINRYSAALLSFPLLDRLAINFRVNFDCKRGLDPRMQEQT
jgi:hypothetical protein